jgi:hypothetical protein
MNSCNLQENGWNYVKLNKQDSERQITHRIFSFIYEIWEEGSRQQESRKKYLKRGRAGGMAQVVELLLAGVRPRVQTPILKKKKQGKKEKRKGIRGSGKETLKKGI